MFENCYRRGVGRHFDQFAMTRSRTARAAEVQSKVAEHVPLCVKDRRGPTGAQAVREREIPVIFPQWIGGNILNNDRLAPVSGCPAGARTRSDGFAVNSTVVTFREARSRSV